MRLQTIISKRTRSVYFIPDDHDLAAAAPGNLLELWRYCAEVAAKVGDQCEGWKVSGAAGQAGAEEFEKIRAIRIPSGNGPGVFRVFAQKNSAHYLYSRIESDLEEAWVVWKLGFATSYNVRYHAKGWPDCECMGFLARNYCRHVEALHEVRRFNVGEICKVSPLYPVQL